MTEQIMSAPASFVRRLAGRLLAPLLAAVALAAVWAPTASADPAWELHVLHGGTRLAPGGEGIFMIHPQNLGTTAGTGTVTLTDQLPEDVVITGFSPLIGSAAEFCTGVGTSQLSCEIPGSTLVPLDSSSENGGTGIVTTVKPTGFLPPIIFTVSIDPEAEGTATNVATMSGGGAAQDAVDTEPISFDLAPSVFGISPGSFRLDLMDDEAPFGEPVTHAGAHPYELRTSFDMNQNHAVDPNEGIPTAIPVGKIRNAVVALAKGMIGNPEATPKCSQADFAEVGVVGNAAQCPPATQVGYLNVDYSNTAVQHGYQVIAPDDLVHVALYNLEPPKGQVADFGFNAAGFVQGHIYAELDPARDYAIRTVTPQISDLLAVRSTHVTFWGVPGDPRHDRYRYFASPFRSKPALGSPYNGGAIRPLLTMPMDCGVDNGPSTIEADSWTAPDAFTAPMSAPNDTNVEGCDDPRIRFEPDVTLQPTSRDAGGPTGLDVHLEVPQRNDEVGNAADLYEQNGDVQAIPTPPVKKVVVTMPEGMTISPSAAQGLGSCSSSQIGLGNNDPVTCPDSSQYGTLTLHTPILPKDQPMKGFLYIAKQNDNPFNDFLALYLVIEDPSRGLRVKVPARVQLDPVTGQIKTTMDNLPQFPIEDTQLSFKGGVRAALVNPTTCGTKAITAEFYSWHDPTTPRVISSSYDITQRPDGSPCVKGLGDRPFSPSLSAGTINNNAGSYSPFAFRLTRTDDDQEFSQLGVTLPPGLLANISELDECSDAGIAQASTPGRTALAEQVSPSCPLSSQIGTTDVGAGVGVPLTYVPGKAYLGGPYRGAPLSMVVITPLRVGPYDLGVIAVRSAIHVDPTDAQVQITTDPFPQIYKGIPVRIRDIRVKADRPNTTINPTSCDPMAVTAHVTGTGADVNTTADDTAADLSERFQAANCASLPFKPKLSFRLKGGTRRGQFPALQATLRGREGDANIARTTVILPVSEYIEQGHIRTVCTRVQFAANQCPRGSIYGHAAARSPLFDETLSGPVYLRSNGGERVLPDLVVKLGGKVDVTLAGFIDSKRDGRVRSAFDVIPDAPVTWFKLSMYGARKSLLVNHLDLCKVTARATVRMIGQNGKRVESRPKMGTSCPKGRKKG